MELSDCSAHDAAAVFDVLRTAFPQASPADRPGGADGSGGPVATPADTGAGGATVWTETFDISGAADAVPPGAAGTLTRPVSADVQGGYLAVDQLRAFLASVFAVSGEGAAFGDQEKDVHLCLANR
ncbi:hypothetical protein STRAU_3403 [Streptomyces aurantiacus JA 4570]|uniref:Uncharacterized protein n=1 Tax=Streptomyces aurantiacus JA 4570 TaxID=1286094 RepID=S3ZLD2_9ACTN|nr:hypothetical protein STRAU_3403 [Streptomyces aurantiacus JA 4570]